MQAAVNLLAKVTGINETKLAYYLDMYYQLRDAYEAAKAEERLEAQQAEDALLQAFCQPPTYPGSPRTMNVSAAPAAADEEPEDTLSPAEDGQETEGGQDAPETEDKLPGFVPVEVKTGSPSAQAAAEKRRIKERLDRLRAAGVSVKRLVKTANGNITEEQIREILDCHKMPIAVYRVLDGVMNTLEGSVLDAQQLP